MEYKPEKWDGKYSRHWDCKHQIPPVTNEVGEENQHEHPDWPEGHRYTTGHRPVSQGKEFNLVDMSGNEYALCM